MTFRNTNSARTFWRPQAIKLAVTACALLVGVPAFADLTITPTFTSAFVTNFGANAVAAENSWIAAANVFETNFSDPVHINITVDAVAGTGVFGESSTGLVTFNSNSYTNMHNALVADAKTPDDFTSIGAGGSLPAADPTGGGTIWASTAEAKALGIIADSTLNNDGTTTFGAGNPFTFSGPIAAGTYDFEGVAAHEISEVMGRLGLKDSTIAGFANSYSVVDLFSFTGPGTRSLAGGANANFSINDGTNLLKLYNNWPADGLDSRDWAPASQGGSGAPDSFNQFSNSGVTNSVTNVDLQELDVIGYDRKLPSSVPEPTSVVLLGTIAMIVGLMERRRRASAQDPGIK